MMNKKLEIIKLIKTNLTSRGKGVEGDPYRNITQYWTMDGDLFVEYDPFKDKFKGLIKGGVKSVLNINTDNLKKHDTSH